MKKKIKKIIFWILGIILLIIVIYISFFTFKTIDCGESTFYGNFLGRMLAKC